jgi:hypothetical protein
MMHNPSLTLVAGTAVSAPSESHPCAGPDRKIIAAARQIEAQLPAHAELHRKWAKASRAAHAFADANFPPYSYKDGEASPHFVALRSKMKENGVDVAQDAMSALHDKIQPLVEKA